MSSTRPTLRPFQASLSTLALFAVFCVALVAGDLSAQTITRAPYLQVGTSTSVTVRWRTDVASTGRVRYGTDAANLSSVADMSGSAIDHTVKLTGLSPDTRYFYSVGTTTAVLASGPGYKFVTSPPSDKTSKPMRIWVIGDAGTGTTNQAVVRDAYSTYTGTRETDLWLVLGDNAYENGTDAEYQAKHFNMYPAMLRSSVSWYTLGNHDAYTGSVGAHPYHTMFSFPTAGEAGGVASGSKNYYSFNYGNVHFISLDSQETNRTPSGAMASWLQSDLQQNTKPWIIAFWHHPPYSKGSHDSDTESQLIDMRTTFLPILEQYGVDLVLSGHSHSYERSYLIDGHYGHSSTFNSSMVKKGGSGRPSDTGAYTKPSVGPAPREGAVYAVAGSSGKVSGLQGRHPAMFISLNNLGSMVLDIDGDRMDAAFLRETGVLDDTFTLIKGSTSGNRPPDAWITSPASGATFSAPASIALSASASDDSGVSQVAFYNGPTLLGTTGVSPYSVTWNNPPAGAHRLTARATDNSGLVHISAPVFITVNAAAPAVPAAPTNLGAGTMTTSSVPLTWTDNATNETGYQVERAIGSGSFSLLVSLGANANSHTDATVAAGTSYQYRVRAGNANGNSGYSNTLSVTTPSLPVPAAPTNLAAGTMTTSSVPLTWIDNATNETGYQLERAIGSGSFSLLVALGANANSHTDATVAAGTSYRYRVRAGNANGNSAYSNTLSVTTPAITIPAKPTNLDARAISSSQITLTWSDNSNNETSFRIDRRRSGGSYSQIATVGANVKTFTDSGLSRDRTYTYRVRATNSAGSSSWSDSDSARTLQ